MIKHKLIVKHKKPPYVPPWERKDLGKWERPDPYRLEARMYDANIQAGAFTWMVYWCFKGKFNIHEVANTYWRYAMDEPFPEKGGNADAILRTILKNLKIKYYKRNRVELKDGEEDAFPSQWLEFWDDAKHLHINKEATMAKKFKDLAEPDKVESTPGGPRMTLKRQASIRCFELLLEQEHTDEEIIEIVKDELEYNFIPSMIIRRRKMLNEGDAEDFGFEVPEEPIEEIGGNDPGNPAPVIKKPPLKPAKKKATKVKSSLKKPLTVQKFKSKKFTLRKKA